MSRHRLPSPPASPRRRNRHQLPEQNRPQLLPQTLQQTPQQHSQPHPQPNHTIPILRHRIPPNTKRSCIFYRLSIRRTIPSHPLSSETIAYLFRSLRNANNALREIANKVAENELRLVSSYLAWEEDGCLRICDELRDEKGMLTEGRVKVFPMVVDTGKVPSEMERRRVEGKMMVWAVEGPDGGRWVYLQD